MIGLDTTAIIDLFERDEQLKKVILEQKEPLATTIINYAEIYFGLDPENKRHQLEKVYYDEFLNEVYLVEFSKEALEKIRVISWELKRKGKPIEKFDSIIAGLFLTNGISKIITRNKKHFENINGLEVISY
ncbi:type II toxin-antitoxin system VapC family toxin [Candidatus Woesearchaeota archaeon]|nr:type II toxin-antitoxin system VapC family toxin [Candidatus Woesearchaeota archaeon]